MKVSISALKEKWRSVPLTVKVSTAYVVCSVLQRAISFFTMPLFTRLLTTEQYGQSTVYSSWNGIFSIVLTLNLAYGSFGPAMMKYEDDREGYISSIEGIFLLLTDMFLAIYLPLEDFWNSLLELPTEFVLLLLAETIATNSVLLWSGKKRYEFKYKSVVALTLATSITGPLFALLLVSRWTEKGYARIVGYSLTNIVAGALIFLLNVKRGKKLFNKTYWRYALNFNVPLLAYYLSQMIFNQSDRIMISHYFGTSEAAMYGVAYNLAMILTFVLNAINNSYVPWFYGKVKKKSAADNRRVANMIAALMAVLILAVIWLGPEIIYVMAGEQYMSAIYCIPPVAISLLLLFYSQLFINVQFYFEEKGGLVAASIFSAVLNIVLNMLLLPRFGYVAAGYTTLVSYIVFVVLNYFAMKKTLARRGIPDEAFDYKGLLTVILVFVGCSFLGLALYSNLTMRIVVVVVAAVFVIVKRKAALELFNKLKSI